MTQLKAHEVDGWLDRNQVAAVPVILIYGPDRGLVSERGRRFAERSGVALDDPFSVVKLEATELDKDAARLLDEANTVPMFAGRRLLWVRNAQGHKSLADAVKVLCAAPPPDTTILIEAGDLKKGTSLRSAVETAKTAVALPCYADDARSIDALIDDELRKAGLAIEPEAKALLRSNLGGDRMASRAEVAKLTQYALGQQSVSVQAVRALTGDVAGISLDEAVDAVLEGNLPAFDAAFARLAQNPSQVFAILSALQRQAQSLQLMRAAMERDGRNAASIVAAARPPVFFTRKKFLEQSLERWTSQGLSSVLARLHATVLQTRRRPDLAAAAAHKTLVEIAVEAAREARRRSS